MPARPLDEAARTAARSSGELVAWLAACSGSARPVVASRIVGIVASGQGAPPDADVVVTVAGSVGRPLAVGAVAAAVDAGRELARAAAADGVTVLAGTSPAGGEAAGRLAGWLTGELSDQAVRGPLSALRRLGDEPACTLCGLALGAGERGLAYLCDGRAAMTAAALAVAIEPALTGRVLAAGPHAAFGLRAAPGDDVVSALDALRAAAR